MANKNISKTRASVCVFSVILTHFSSSFFKGKSFFRTRSSSIYQTSAPRVGGVALVGGIRSLFPQSGFGFSYPAASHLPAVVSIGPVPELLTTAKL